MNKIRTRTSRAAVAIEICLVTGVLLLLVIVGAITFDRSQTRSKAARVRTDFIEIRKALVAYRSDHGSIPRSSWGCPPISDLYDGVPRWGLLTPIITTPVAYLTEFKVDPFELPGTDDGPDPYYTYESYPYYQHLREIGVVPCTAPELPGYVYIPGTNYDSHRYYFGDYALLSAGPDKTFSPSFYLQYDPSNGTVSSGNIIAADKFATPRYVPHNAFP